MLPIGANAAGMGKITVLSALGQPLRAELDVTASREELASIAARVAPIEAFRQANVEYATVLSSIQFTLDKRPNGQAYFKIQTDRPVSDPFIDFLVELSWSSGRLVREYAFLLDPPEREGTVAGNVSPFVPVPEVASPPTEEAVAEMSSQVEKLAPPAPAARQPVAIAESDEERSRTVKSGDTLTKIAKENMADGVSLDQMLVLLFNSNRDAFDGANMNRLRAGKILSIPEPAEIAATVVSASEAKKTVIAQSSDFNAYRNRLADAAANQEVEADVSHQSSVGKVSPKVEEKQLVVSGQDKLQVSRNEQGATKGKASEEDLVAREKALKEANSRVAELEKNLSDLKKLVELKAQQAPVAAVETGPGKGIALPVETPPATDTSISAVAALPPDAVLSATAAEQAAPKKKRKVKKPAAEPPPPPTFMEQYSLFIYGGGLGIAAILGFLGFRTWKRKRDEAAGTGITASDLAANSVFGAVVPGMDDGSNNVSASSFSHSILDTAPEHKEGVDPIQEAEVYMAYGRDGQAEEILLDALQKTPGNLAVHGKLLEIYAGRKSLPQFSTVVSDLHARTGGAGAEWEKAAELGRAIDPSNPLYTSATDTAGLPHQQTQVMPLDVDEAAQMDATMVLAAPIVLESSVTAPHIPPVAAETDSSGGLDFDLDLGAVATTPTAAEPAEMPANSAESSLDMDFDMDLGADRGPTGQGKSEDGNSIDFDIAAQTTTIETSVPTAKEDSPLDFNFDMDVPTVATEPAPPLDLSSINLELDAPQAEGSTGEASEVATKLELALAYDEMGDREGARELLQEVLAEGSPAQQELARAKLAQLT